MSIDYRTNVLFPSELSVRQLSQALKQARRSELIVGYLTKAHTHTVWGLRWYISLYRSFVDGFSLAW